MSERLDDIKYDLQGLVIGETVWVNAPQVVGLLLDARDAVRAEMPDAANALETIAKVIDGINKTAREQLEENDD